MKVSSLEMSGLTHCAKATNGLSFPATENGEGAQKAQNRIREAQEWVPAAISVPLVPLVFRFPEVG
jgi:hypothetical protein